MGRDSLWHAHSEPSHIKIHSIVLEMRHNGHVDHGLGLWCHVVLYVVANVSLEMLVTTYRTTWYQISLPLRPQILYFGHDRSYMRSHAHIHTVQRMHKDTTYSGILLW